jgi:hypothetical protein
MLFQFVVLAIGSGVDFSRVIADPYLHGGKPTTGEEFRGRQIIVLHFVCNMYLKIVVDGWRVGEEGRKMLAVLFAHLNKNGGRLPFRTPIHEDMTTPVVDNVSLAWEIPRLAPQPLGKQNAVELGKFELDFSIPYHADGDNHFHTGHIGYVPSEVDEVHERLLKEVKEILDFYRVR